MQRNVDIFHVAELIASVPTRLTAAQPGGGAGERVLLGTHDGQALSYAVERTAEGRVKTVYMDKKGALARGKKAVEALELLEEAGRAVALLDEQVLLLDARSLETLCVLEAVKGAQGLCTDRRGRPPGTKKAPPRVCVFGKKRIQVLELTEASRLELRHEYELTKGPITQAAWLGSSLFFAAKRGYFSLLVETGAEGGWLATGLDEGSGGGKEKGAEPLLHLLDYDQGLLLRAEHTGLLADATGAVSGKRRVNWSCTPGALAYQFPYVVALCGPRVEVHSVLDQGLLQTLPLPDAAAPLGALADGGGPSAGLLLCWGSARVLGLVALPLERQLQALLDVSRDQEAILLFQRTAREGGAALTAKMRQFYVQVGMSLLRSLQFAKAFEYLHKSDVRVEDVLGALPGLLPRTMEAARPPPLDVPGLVRRVMGPQVAGEQLAKASTKYLAEARLQMIHYLERARAAHLSDAVGLGLLDTGLVKLYALSGNEAGLRQFLTAHAADLQASPEELADWARDSQQHHAVALVLAARGREREALELWRRLGRSELTDAAGHNGVQDTVSRLGASLDAPLVFEFARWVLETQPSAGLRIFTERTGVLLPPDEVLEFLRPLPAAVGAGYLEHVVRSGLTQQERHHTLLASLYIDTVLALLPADFAQSAELLRRAGSEGGLLQQTRAKLRVFLETSQLYAPVPLLSRVEPTPLYHEQVTLHTRLGQHQAAVKVLVHKLANFAAAEEYCLAHEPRDEELFMYLLQLYLADGAEQQQQVGGSAARLLVTYAPHLAPARVLPLLPAGYPLHQLQEYLVRTMQHSLHAHREALFVRNCSKSENMQQKTRLLQYRSRGVMIHSNKACALCGKRIGEATAFSYYPNGTVVHYKCSKDKHIEPSTGRDFRLQPIP